MIGRHAKAGRGPGVPAAYPIRGRTVHTGILNSSLAAHRSLRRGAALGRETVTAVPHLPAGGISLPDSSRPVSIHLLAAMPKRAPAGLTCSRSLGRLDAIRKCGAVDRMAGRDIPSHSGSRSATNLSSSRFTAT